MYHHDSRDYNVAVSEAANKFQVKVEEMIHASVPRVSRVIEQVQSDVPEDAIVLGKANLSEWANFRSTHSVSGWSGRGRYSTPNPRTARGRRQPNRHPNPCPTPCRPQVTAADRGDGTSG